MAHAREYFADVSLRDHEARNVAISRVAAHDTLSQRNLPPKMVAIGKKGFHNGACVTAA